MSTDLEQRLHDELLLRAHRVGAWPGAGPHVRRVAAERRARRLRAGTALGAAAAVLAVVVGVSLAAGGRPDSAPPAGVTRNPTSSPTSSPTGSPTNSPSAAATRPRPELIQVPVSEDVVKEAMAGLSMSGWPTELLATATLPRSGDLLLVLSQSPPLAEGDYYVVTVTIRDGRPMAGTLTQYGQDEDLVAQPARDGDDDGATMVVLVPRGTEADSIEVTTSLPGRDIRTPMVSLGSGLALVPLPSPHNVTRVRLVRGGETVQDRSPVTTTCRTRSPGRSDAWWCRRAAGSRRRSARTAGRPAVSP